MINGFTRSCPKCNCQLIYQNFDAYQRATRRQSVCKSCGGRIIPIKSPPAKTNGDGLPSFWSLIDEQLSGSQVR